MPVPLFHCFGMVMGNLAGVTCGATVVYPASSFDAEATLTAVEQERVAPAACVPTCSSPNSHSPDFERFDLSSLRTGIISGGTNIHLVIEQVVDRMHMPGITIAYGMTETVL